MKRLKLNPRARCLATLTLALPLRMGFRGKDQNQHPLFLYWASVELHHSELVMPGDLLAVACRVVSSEAGAGVEVVRTVQAVAPASLPTHEAET